MRIAMTGATGFIGARIRALLEAGGHELRLISRRARPGFYEWRSHEDPPPAAALAGADAVIHLAGEPVAQRWTPEVRRRIRESRVRSTARLVEALAQLEPRPPVLVCASATGYYGDRG